jgi:DNA-binding MarR family transcriptional regulator
VVEEIRQTKPFATAAEEAAVALLRTADVVNRRYQEVVATRGITVQQYNVLRILRGAAPEPMPTLEIAERMIEETPGITRLLDRLEAKGLVERRRCSSDRRQVLCSITAAGAEVLARLEAPMAAATRAGAAGLSEAETRSLLVLLDRLRAGYRGDGD